MAAENSSRKNDTPSPASPEAMFYPGFWAGVAAGYFLLVFGAFLPERHT